MKTIPPRPSTLSKALILTAPELERMADDHGLLIEFDGDWAVCKVGTVTYCAPLVVTK